jgi:hypothetical protein
MADGSPEQETRSRTTVLRQLVAELDHDDSNVAEEAQSALIAYGQDSLEPLLAAAPNFAPFGRLCAIEIFGSIALAR